MNFDFFLIAMSSKNATGGRFFVSFFYCQKNEHKYAENHYSGGSI